MTLNLAQRSSKVIDFGAVFIPAKIWGVPFGVDPSCWGSAKSEHVRLINREIIFFQNSEITVMYVCMHVRVRDIGVNIAGHLYLRLRVTVASAYHYCGSGGGESHNFSAVLS